MISPLLVLACQFVLFMHSAVNGKARYKGNAAAGIRQTGTGPINILQRKFYTTLIFKQSDWLLKFVNQSGCLKISVA